MLARAALRSSRVCRVPAPIQASFPSFQSRPYAKNSKPKKPFEYKAPTGPNAPNRHGPIIQQPNGPTADAAESQSSGQPSSTKPESDVPFERSANKSTHPDYSELQDEFQTAAPTAGNTESQSTSPSAIDPAEAQRQAQEQKPFRPLPDLTQGIPSTLDAEIAASSSHADPKSLNITEAPAQPGGQGGGDLPKSAYISSSERRRTNIARNIFITSILGSMVGAIYLGRNWESEEEELAHLDAPSGWGIRLMWRRAFARWGTTLDYYNEPAFSKLLPDVDPSWERPYTLVLSLEDLLVHSEWSRQHGWRMAKRPGVDYFLRYLSQYYELVVFTSQPSMSGGPIIQKLDPYKVIMWPLFREATRYSVKTGEYVKDLSFLNRDLSKVIMVDTVPSHAKLQPENSIIIPKWKGDLQDKGLVALIPFLEFVGADLKDTREVLKSFDGTDIPTEFARREALHREKFMKELDGRKGKKPRGGPSVLGSLLGAKPQPSPDGIEYDQTKTYNDMVRERGQKQYEMLEKEIQANGEQWLKDMAEEEKKMQDDAMKGMKSSITSFIPIVGGEKKES